MPKFKIIFGERVISEPEINLDLITIGRSPKCHIYLNNQAVSRIHAKIEYRNGTYIVEDLGSKNGILVNGRRVKFHPIDDGDEIVVSKFIIRFVEKGQRPIQTNKFTATSGPGQQKGPRKIEPFIMGPPSTERTAVLDGASLRQQYEEYRAAKSPHLRLRTGAKIERFPLDKRLIIIGKGERADIQITGLFAKANHAQIELVEDGYWIKVNGFIPAVSVNGEKVKAAKLEAGSIIQIGKYLFSFHEAQQRD